MTDIAGMESPGWSNSDAVDHAPDDVSPEVAPAPQHEPGFSNGEAADAPSAEPVEHAITEPTAEPDAPAKKTTARKSTAQKKG